MANTFKIGDKIVVTRSFQGDCNRYEVGQTFTVGSWDHSSCPLRIEERDEWIDEDDVEKFALADGQSSFSEFLRTRHLDPQAKLYKKAGLKYDDGRWTEEARSVLLGILLDTQHETVLLPLVREFLNAKPAAPRRSRRRKS